MNFKHIITLILFFTISTSYAQFNCKKFKDGTFKMTEGGMTCIIKRKGSKQFETMNGETSLYHVKWIDECTYTLKPSKKEMQKHPEFPENALLTVKIIEVKENSYILNCTANFADINMTSEMVKTD